MYVYNHEEMATMTIYLYLQDVDTTITGIVVNIKIVQAMIPDQSMVTMMIHLQDVVMTISGIVANIKIVQAMILDQRGDAEIIIEIEIEIEVMSEVEN